MSSNNLYKCPDCGNLVSKSAVSCPKCGRVLKKEKMQTVRTVSSDDYGVLIGIIVIIVLFIYFKFIF